MRAEDLILVSVDDHVVEPPHMFDNHLPERWKDLAPKFITKDDGTDVWAYEGAQIPNIGLNAVAGRPPDEWGMEPASLDEIRPGCFDPDARILELSTKCAPGDTLDTSSRAKDFLENRGVDLGGEQQTKTKTALEFFSKELQSASSV